VRGKTHVEISADGRIKSAFRPPMAPIRSIGLPAICYVESVGGATAGLARRRFQYTTAARWHVRLKRYSQEPLKTVGYPIPRKADLA